MTQSSEGNPPPVSFIDNPHAPEVYADGVSGAFIAHGNIRLTFEAARVNHISSPGPVNRVVIGRVVMPLSAAENLRDFLTDMLKNQSQPSAQHAAPRTLQ